MPRRLTDQAAVAVTVARAAAEAAGQPATIGHLLLGLATESEGRAGRRLRERATAVLHLTQRAPGVPAPPLDTALTRAAASAGSRAISTVDLLDAAIACGGDDVTDLLEAAGFHRDLDGWLVGGPDEAWFDDPETVGWSPTGDDLLDPYASRVAAIVRAVGGGAVEVLIAAAAAPAIARSDLDPATLARAAATLPPEDLWDAGLDAVVTTAGMLPDTGRATVADLLRAALIAGGDGPRRVLAAASAEGP